MSSTKDVKGFSLYPAYRDSLALLSDSDRGQLLMALFDYYDGTDTSASLTPPAQMAFAFIAPRMEADRDRVLRRSQVNRENATKRWPRQASRESAAPGAEDG
jgi:hypothetical protein